MILQCLLLAAVLAIPQVERVVGVRALYSAPIVMGYALWIAIAERWLVPRARTEKLAFDLLNVGDVFLGVAVVVALPLASGEPTSPLWVFAVMFAGINGADYDYGPSWIVLLAHTLSPLLGIPVYWMAGASPSSAIGGPVFIAVTCLVVYHYSAIRRTDVRQALAERDELERALAQERALRERERLARDLHDSVGASLSTAALYADLLAKRTDPESVRSAAEAIAEATRGGLVELRGLLDALAPDELDARAFGDALRVHARRVAASAGLDALVELEGEPGVKLPSALRFGIARVFQEGLSNAVKHAGARRLVARLSVHGGLARLELEDDGVGFEPAAEAAGRGVKGMRARTQELGGRFEIGRGSAGGTRIVAELPLGAAQRALSE